MSMAMELGPVGLSAHSFPEILKIRTAVAAEPCDPERYRLSVITDSPQVESGKIIMLHFPKAALPLRPSELGPLLPRQLTTDTGMGAVLAHYLTSVATVLEKGEVGHREGEQLGKVALDLTVAALTTGAGVDDVAVLETRRRTLLAKIDAFIEHNLGDPDLTPSAIAGHCHISLGHLHRLYQTRELTIAAWIRHRRLECCRADLADPRLRRWPVHAIGARWGFRGAAEFSRAFRAVYGSAPGQYRHQVLTGRRGLMYQNTVPV